MPECTVFYREFEIVVRLQTNGYGAWVASVNLKNGTGTVVDVRPMAVQPEWLTEEEAMRDAIEWSHRFIDRELNTLPSHSWVTARSRAESWFRAAEEKSRVSEINA